MSVMSVLSARRSIRRFSAEPPAREAIVALVEAALWAPSASNKQPWRFLVVSDRAAIDKAAAAVRGGCARVAQSVRVSLREGFEGYAENFTAFASAPVLICPLYRVSASLSGSLSAEAPPAVRGAVQALERDSALLSTGMAVQNLLLEAHARGLGACVMTGPLLALEEVSAALGVPQGWQLASVVALGHPEEAPEAPPRHEAEKCILWGKRG